jgi:hypothetical protein
MGDLIVGLICIAHSITRKCLMLYDFMCNEARVLGTITLSSSLKTGDEESHEQETTASFIVLGIYELMHGSWSQVKAV